MNKEEIEKLKHLAKNIEKNFPDGFVLLTFKFNDNRNTSETIYVSNANRQDSIKAMKKWLENFDNDKEEIKLI